MSAADVRARGDDEGWTAYRDDRSGLSLRYPSRLLTPQPADAGAPRILLSRDGRARMVVSAGLRGPSETIESYRAFLLARLYAGTRVTYAPRHDTWFVISGLRGAEIFYERVLFACGGRLIMSFALTYPAGEREIYDRVVEGVARSFSPVSGSVCDAITSR